MILPEGLSDKDLRQEMVRQEMDALATGSGRVWPREVVMFAHRKFPCWFALNRIMKRNENSLRDLWDNINHTNIHIIGVPKRES